MGTRERFLNNISEDFAAMAKVIIKQFRLARSLMQGTADNETSSEVEHNERVIDSLDVKIRDGVINAIVLYNPRTSDLRKIMSYYDMTAYLERIGDLLLNVSGFLKNIDIEGEIFPPFEKKLTKLLTVSEKMTQNAIFAFDCEDNALAKVTIEMDDTADSMRWEIVDTLRESCSGRELSASQVADLLNISGMAANLERIGDNATNIAEAAIYLMEGKNIKHANNS